METGRISATDPALQTLPHFSPAEAVAGLHPGLFDIETCRQWILLKIHRKGPRCPDCGLTAIPHDSFWRGKRICCPGCSTWFTASTGTILAGSTLDYREVYTLGVLIGIGLADVAIAERLGINRKTVAEWRRKLQGI